MHQMIHTLRGCSVVISSRIRPMGSFVFMVSRGVSVVCRVANQNDPIIRLMLLTKKWDHCYYGAHVLKTVVLKIRAVSA